MLNKTLTRLGWKSVPFSNKAATYYQRGIAKTKTRRQDLDPLVVLHMTQGLTGGASTVTRYATKETKSAVCLWFASAITTSCEYKYINKWDAVRVIGSEGSKTGFSLKLITLPITAPSWGLKGAGRNVLGRKRRSKITGLLLETNHSGRIVVQVEIVGFARDCKNFTDAEYEELGAMLADISEAITEATGESFYPRANLDIPRVDDPASRSKRAKCRFTWKVWEMRRFNVCMHSNVCNNDHGDCGWLDVDRVCHLARLELARRNGAFSKPTEATTATQKPAKALSAGKAIEKSLKSTQSALAKASKELDAALTKTKDIIQ